MAARGSIAKEEVMNKILATFPGAFKYEKELRIPMMENGEELQIKVTLTAAKNMVAPGGDTALPGMQITKDVIVATPQGPVIEKMPVEPSEAEKKNVVNLLDLLNL